MNRARVEYIIIVSGLPRSGTSMMMQMLHAGGVPVLVDQSRPADQSNPLGYFELAAVKATRHDSNWLKDAPGKAVKVILQLLPELPASYRYRVLMMQRSLDQVVDSQTRMLSRLGKSGANLSPANLQSVFAQQMQRMDAWLGQQTNFTCMPVHYDQVLAQPEPSVQQVADFLQVELNLHAMRQAVVPELCRTNLAHPSDPRL